MIQRRGGSPTSEHTHGGPELPGADAGLLVVRGGGVRGGAWPARGRSRPSCSRRSPTAGRDRVSERLAARDAITQPRLCLTDGRVEDRRYTPLVAVQRPCGSVAPQNTMLEPVGGDMYRIQWHHHHPDYGKRCLKTLTDEPGAGLLEPMDACQDGSRFHIEPSGADGSGRAPRRLTGLRGHQGVEYVRGHRGSDGAVRGQGRPDPAQYVSWRRGGGRSALQSRALRAC